MATKPETQVETVTLEDGRIVEFAGKRKLLKESFVAADGRVQIRLDFRNGQTRLFTIPDTLLLKFAAHGAEQKLGDEIAGVDDIEDCVLGIDELIDRLYAGDWSQKREANGLAGTSVLVKALVEALGKPIDVVKAFLAKKTHAEKIALRNSDKLKPIVARLEAEKASRSTTKVDTDALLGELESGGSAGSPAEQPAG